MELDATLEDGEAVGPPSMPEEVPESVSTFTDKKEFLGVIHMDFLKVVQPIESGLVDVLRSLDIVSSDEENEIGGEKTRRDKARKLWNILHRVPSLQFAENVVPALKAKYPHVVQRREFQLPSAPEGICVRHTIMERMPLKRFADILPSLKCCTQAEYSKIAEATSPSEEHWDSTFVLLQKNSDNPEVGQKLAKILSDKQVGVSADFQQLLQDGFQCTCNDIPLEQLPKFELLKPMMSLRLDNDGDSTGSYPSSPLSQCGESRVDSGIGYALSVSSDEWLPEESSLEQFEKLTEKLQYKAINNKLSEGRVHAANIRTLLRFLEGSRDEVCTFAKKAKDEGHNVTASKTEVDRFLHRATKVQKEIEQLYDKVYKTTQEVKDLDACFDFELPPNQRRKLLQLKHLLEMDFVEAQHFANTSKEVLKEITQLFVSQSPGRQ